MSPRPGSILLYAKHFTHNFTSWMNGHSRLCEPVFWVMIDLYVIDVDEDVTDSSHVPVALLTGHVLRDTIYHDADETFYVYESYSRFVLVAMEFLSDLLCDGFSL